MKHTYRTAILGMCLACSGILASCGNSDDVQHIQINISDAYEHSSFESKPGRTVRQLLEEAEITIDPEDSVSPELDQTLYQDQTIEILRSHDVVIDYEKSQPIAITVQGGNVGDAISKAGIILDDSMVINMSLDRCLSDGLDIVISKLAYVKVKADGHLYKEFTDAKTVQEFLSELGIKLEKRDRISKSMDSPVTNGMKLVINRVKVQKETEKQEIPYETIQESSAALDVGTTQVKQAGEPGEKEIIYRVVYVDGKEESRKVLKEKITKEAVDEIILSGTRQPQSAIPSNPGSTDSSAGQTTQNPQTNSNPTGKTVTSVQELDDCDGSGHGVRITTYSDGTEEIEEY